MSTVPFQPSPMLDRLSTYEIAVLEFSSPSEIGIDDISDTGIPLLLTSKAASYLWAGAIAYVFENRRDFTSEEVLDLFRDSVKTHCKYPAFRSTHK
jgi:hypothetical protein